MKEEQYIAALRLKIESYSPISSKTWNLIRPLINFTQQKREAVLIRNGQTARDIFFVCEGALRAYFTDEAGAIYTKNLFLENDFAGSTVSYLLNQPSQFTLDALEDSILIHLNYKAYRTLIDNNAELNKFYIAYLERNWVIEKEDREVSLVMEDATARYQKLLRLHPNIENRIQKIHIASHLGITPTQLSRIRKSLTKNS